MFVIPEENNAEREVSKNIKCETKNKNLHHGNFLALIIIANKILRPFFVCLLKFPYVIKDVGVEDIFNPPSDSCPIEKYQSNKLFIVQVFYLKIDQIIT